MRRWMGRAALVAILSFLGTAPMCQADEDTDKMVGGVLSGLLGVPLTRVEHIDTARPAPAPPRCEP